MLPTARRPPRSARRDPRSAEAAVAGAGKHSGAVNRGGEPADRRWSEPVVVVMSDVSPRTSIAQAKTKWLLLESTPVISHWTRPQMK